MINRVFDIVVYVIFAIILLWGIKISHTKNKYEICKRLNVLRGIFALEIILGHVIRYDNTLLYPLGKFMIISVAYFFFVSAFGMVLSFQKKGNAYFEGFLKKKAGYLFGLAVLIFCVNLCWDLLIPAELGYMLSERNMVSHFFYVTNWYIWEQIIFYILFYLIYKYVPKFRVLLFTIVTIAMCILFFRLGFIQGWYSSALAFPLGLLYGEYFEKCQKVFKSWKGKVLTIVFCIIGLGSLLLPAESMIGMIGLRNVMCIGVLFVLVYFCMNFECGNRIAEFLTKYSTELYLSQFAFLGIAKAYGLGYKQSMVFVLIATFLSALCLHFVTKKIKYILNR